MKYDDSEFYFLNFESELPNEAGATHIGMYMTWLILNGLVSEKLDGYRDEIQSNRKTARDLLLRYCDGKLMDDDLNERGNAFTSSYYDHRFIKDYITVFNIEKDTADAVCAIEDSWENYQKLKPTLDARLLSWTRAPRIKKSSDPSPLKLPEKEVLLDVMEQSLAPFLADNHFLPCKQIEDEDSGPARGRTFDAAFEGGRHRINLNAWSETQHMEFTLTVESRLDALAKASYADRHGSEPPPNEELGCTAYLIQSKWIGEEHGLEPDKYGSCNYVVRSVDDVQPNLAHLRFHVSTRLPSILRKMETLQGMDALLNTSPVSGSVLFTGDCNHTHLMCAYLARNPRILELCDELQARTEKAHRKVYGNSIAPMLEHIERIRKRAKLRS